MKLEHTKSAESLIRGCSVAQQVHLLSQLRILELMGGTRSLPTPGLCQPRSLPEPLASYRSTMPLQVQSHGTSTALGILNRYFVGVSARQQPHPYGRSIGNTSSMSLSARTAGGHSLEKKGDSSVVCILTNLLPILSNPLTKGQQGVGQPKYTHLPKWGKSLS